jgi:hypothetical protein
MAETDGIALRERADAHGNGAAHDEVARLVERMNEPQTAAAMHTLLDNIELLAVIVSGIDGLARKGETIGDTIAEVLAEARAAGRATGLDVRTTSRQLSTLIPALADAAPAIQRIVASPIVNPEPIAVLSEAAEALVKGVKAAQENDSRLGLGGLLKALRDDDVQRTVGFVIEVARVFGKEVSNVRIAPGSGA